MPLQIQDDYLHCFFSLAEVFSSATGLAAVVVDIKGKALSEYHNFNSFCTRMRSHPQYLESCQKCDKYCAFEGLKEEKIRIICCHAGLSCFSMPLINAGQLHGFIICGQVRAKYQEYKTILIDDDRQWIHDPEIKSAWEQVKVVDNNHLVAAANLLSFIINNLNPAENVTREEAKPQLSELRFSYAELSRHEKKLAAALRYIDEHLYDELTLESVAAHVCLSANYFSRFFKKRQGVNFKTWVSQKKMQRAGELLRDPTYSIDSIARKLQYAQTSYFCRVFRAAHRTSPQSFRHEQLSQ
ncbi:transcriptional regulator [Citrobacter amalonaticus]|uniref:Transcriptional regulator n=1 Tax=Citrobacter amalonaticus TaxID=35703 RepID=A0A2S4RZP1_CITAM|nr:PocR ligand-binding domain-containing protein [Citrobacter amalonaticus]POT58129.1 transcriptional regulator [Citrobacter amalonaticus]POT76346.1 transcriptional regulator [Citrobacter amalonaticus]POU66655.1 transcriptional regulator [Citrobacter amalonaticus]POV05581.1 transcriptional regulator [Citrobacter amalonaticus]